MTKFLHLTCSVILIGCVLSIPHFYHNNKTRCNCEQNRKCSSQDGTCPGDKCAGDYFGINCQHANVSLAINVIWNNVPPVLLDGNDKTCLKQMRGDVFYSFDHTKPLHFIWVYVYAKTTITVKPKVEVHNKHSKLNVTCYILKLNNNSLLIKTHDPIMYNKLILSDLPEDSCSLEFSLGRNLAISSTAKKQIPQILQTIDGNDEFNQNSFVLNKKGKWWRTELLHPARVNLIQLVGAMAVCRIWKLQLKYKNIASQIIDRTAVLTIQTGKMQPGSITKSIKIKADVKSMVSEVGITLKSCALSNPKFVVTEVYIFGEFVCPDDWYGTMCERYCPEGCRRKICDPDWGCPEGCNQNWKGHWCDRKPTTTTTTTATTITSSNSTTTTITTRITLTATTAEKGHNKRCDLFKYGANCEHECSDNCAKNGLCDEDSGICDDGCKPGFIPPSCKTPCRKGTYSVNCSQTCANCAKNSSTGDHICDHSTGYCLFGCDKGYGGDKCEKLITISNISTIFTGRNVAIMCLLSVLLVAFVRSFIKRGSQDSTVDSQDTHPNPGKETRTSNESESPSTKSSSRSDQSESSAVSGSTSMDSSTILDSFTTTDLSSDAELSIVDIA